MFDKDSGKYVGSIYCIKNTVNGKMYVGQTTSTIHKRFVNHIQCAKSGKYTHILLYCAMGKYGVENFTISSLCTLYGIDPYDLKEKLNEMEIYYVSELNTYVPNGYNMTRGGMSFADHCVVPVVRVDKSGIVVKEYGSIQEAEDDVHIQHGSIKRAILGKYNFANGLFWLENRFGKYKVGDRVGKQRRGDLTPVYQFPLNGSLLRSYGSMTEAERESGVSHSKISAACSKKRKSAGGFLWSCCLEVSPYVSNKGAHNRKKVAQFDMNRNLLQTYSSAQQAANCLGLHQSLILKCCRGERKSTGGYQWTFC